jgi:hypothetical protein
MFDMICLEALSDLADRISVNQGRTEPGGVFWRCDTPSSFNIPTKTTVLFDIYRLTLICLTYTD